MNDFIVVRDRRQPKQFSIANVVIDEWLPIIGLPGYAIYSLYVRMAGLADERCWPGYTLIKTHLGLGKSTISDYNKLLYFCRLIHIEEGDRHNTNNYYILDVPEVDTDALHHIRRQAEAELSSGSKLRRTILKRLDRWEPIQALWARPQQQVEVMRPGQMPLPGLVEPVDNSSQSVDNSDSGGPVAEQGGPVAEQGGPVAEQGGPVAEQGGPVAEHPVRPGDCNNPNKQSKRTIQKNNPNEHSTTTGAASGAEPSAAVVELLTEYGVEMASCPELAQCDYDAARAWCLYADTQDLRTPAGFVVSRLKNGASPPHEFTVLAGIGQEPWEWLERHAQTRALTGVWAVGLPVDEDEAETWYEVYYREVKE